MANWWHFQVVAYLADGARRVSPPAKEGSITARDPESATRKWYWRLPAEERGAVDRLIVWGAPKDCCGTPRWPGATIVYRPTHGRMAEVERREISEP